MPIQTATNPKTGARLAFVDDQWKPIEQSATNPQGLKAYKIGGSWLTDDGPSLPEVKVIAAPDIGEIPGKRAEPKPFDLGDFARGVVETPGVLLTGAAGQLAGNVYGPIRSAIEGKYGTREGVQLAQKYAGEAAEALSYAPRTETGKNIVSGVGSFLNESKLSGLNPYTAGELAPLAAPALRQGAAAIKKEAELAAPTILKPFKETAELKAARKSSESWQNAAQIDAAKTARELGLSLNPATSNPTVANKMMGAIAGSENLNTKLSRANEPKWTAIAKREMGISKNEVLNDVAFEKALDAQSKPYDAVRKLPVLTPDQSVIGKLDSLQIRTPAIGGEANAAAVNALIEEAKAKITQGRTGAQVIDDIRQLRRDANVIYKTQSKGGVSDPSLVAKADANMGVANALESLIDANVTDFKLLGELKKSRAKMAQIYDYQRATDPLTNKVDPLALAKMLTENKKLSGDAKRMAEVAANFPSVSFVGPETSNVGAAITRSGLGGAAGYVAGAPFGLGPFTSIIGAGIGGVSSGAAAKYMGGPGYQAARAVPKDFRLPLPAAAPEITPVTNNLPVPYDFRNALLTQKEIPNWVYGRSTPEVKVGPAPVTAPMLEAPSAESTMGGVAQRRAYDLNLARERDLAAAAKAEAEAAKGRKPTGAGTLFELDPVTGKLRRVDQGMKGATPDVIQSTGHALKSATDKVAAGQRFAMSAEERIAWEKTRVDFAQANPELAKLSDKAIAEKALDRSWVADQITKARQKAQAFDEIAKRAKTAQAVREAEIKRDQLMDALDSLEASLGKPRPVSSGAQGPKTREAQRNKLAPKGTNNLRND